MKRGTLLFVLLLSVQSLFAQQSYTISGYVKDTVTGEEVIGAIVSVKELTATGASTNAYGFYSLTIPTGNYTIIVQNLGYITKTVQINLNANAKLNFKIHQEGTQLGEVTVGAEKKNENVTNTDVSMQKLTTKEINTIPVIFGERDVLKTIQLLPGVESAGDGNSGFYVRGGSADQNLILLDEAPVYNASHLLGFFSVFNSDAIKDVTIYKGGMPAEYGGRLSSVLDVKMNDGDDQRFLVSGGIGLIASHLTIQGPIKKNKGSFIISARRTYADLFLKLSTDSLIRQSSLYFYDINVKANYILGDNDRIYLSGYFGKDVLGLGTTFGINWGNATGTLRWNHLFSDKLFCNTSFIVSNYSDNININFVGTSIGILSRIQDYGLKQDYEYFINSKNKIKFGFYSTLHQIVPGTITAVNNSNSSNLDLSNQYAWENAIYAEHGWKANERFSFNYGIRLTAFSVLGPGTFRNYNTATGATIDSSTYGSGQFVTTYFTPEPRVAATYLLNEKSSIKASYDRNAQNMHLISNSTSQNPTDLWIPSSNYVKPEIADQFSLGYFRNLHNNDYEFSTEIYYKLIQNAIDYRDNAQLNFNENIESQLLFGQGRAYGVEFFLKKKYGRLTGWIGYTLSKSEVQISGINNGSWYPAVQDRPNDISVVAIYQLAKKWTVSATFVYYDGSPVTFPSGKYEVDNQVYYYYTSRNGYRMPAYDRMDIGVTWERKKTEKYESSWNFSIYNVYDRWNAYTITFQTNPNNPQETQAVLTALFGIIPSVTYNFKF